MNEAQFNLQQRYDNLSFESQSMDWQELDAIEKMQNTICNINSLLESVPIYKTKPMKFIELFTAKMYTSANDDKAHLHLRYIANKKYNGVIEYLQNNYDLSLFEIDLCSMICLGFSIDTVRVLYNHDNVRSIYNKRSKLRAKLGISSKDHIEPFLNDLITQLAEGKLKV